MVRRHQLDAARGQGEALRPPPGLPRGADGGGGDGPSHQGAELPPPIIAVAAGVVDDVEWSITRVLLPLLIAGLVAVALMVDAGHFHHGSHVPEPPDTTTTRTTVTTAEVTP